MAKQDRYTAPRASTVMNPTSTSGVEVIEDISAQERLDKLEGFFKGNKMLNYILIGAAALVLGYFAYNRFVKGPNEIKAGDALQRASTYMMMDSLNWALNGDGTNPGAIKVAEKYSGTKAGNMACYMAGVVSLKNGDFKTAIKYLERFDGKETLLSTVATGCLGDAYWENGQLDKALAQYQKAGADKDNFQFAPVYLQRAAMIYEKQNKNAEAIKAYTAIKTQFPQSTIARDVDKYLAKLGVTAE
jgi:predicted negative regulator of RcsB-dependent stress response